MTSEAVPYVVHYSDMDTDRIDGTIRTYCGLNRLPDASGFSATNERRKVTCRRCRAALDKGLR